MGTQTMGSNGNGGTQHQKSDGFSKQAPLYNLTFDEVQHQLGDLGKPLSSMNLDELLKSVWTAETEANQGVGSGFRQIDCSEHTQLASASSRPSGDPGKKTVDELWQDIQLGRKKRDTSDHSLDRKKSTLGEMTLEDFLAKAGIVSKSSHEEKNPASVVGVESIGFPQQNVNPQWMQYQIPPIQQQHMFVSGHHQVQQPLSGTGNPVLEVGYHDMQMMGGLSDTQMPGRKRVAPGDVMEKTVERRQKRMIKNRESAARSRARKQAYTHELENKVSRLEEENERLRRQKEAENVLPCVLPPEPKYQLRRTSSSLF